MNKRHRTPTIRTPRTKGGTLYVFPSSTEDIGLNLNERRNKVTLSHYALLNIPKAEDIPYDFSTKKISGENRFNLLNIPGHYDRVLNDGTYKSPGYLLAASLQNYAFNFETVLRNQSSYDYSNPVTVSERVFWKWLKETGAIRWVYNKKTNTFTEVPEFEVIQDKSGKTDKVRTGYKRVVQCIGEIKSGSNTYDTFGVFNETYVNIPSSYGGTPQYFKQYIDDNYSLGQIYSATTAETKTNKTAPVLEGFSNDESNDSRVGYSILTDCYPYGDITTSDMNNQKFSILQPTEDVKPGEEPKYTKPYSPWWKKDDNNNRKGLPLDVNATKIAYLTDPRLDYANTSEVNKSLTDTIYYVKGPSNSSESYYQLNRSRVDSISLVTNINELRHIYHLQDSDNKNLDDNLQLTYDNIAIDKADKLEFEFNTVLIYYSIFDQSGQNVIATNLFGVLFLEAPVDDATYGEKLPIGITKFHLPTYKKVKSGSDGFGTSYSLRVNIKTFDVYDNTDAVINDQTTNAALQEENFNSVLHKLNRSIDLLKTSISINSFIKSKYAELDLKADKILTDNIELKKSYDNIIHNRTSFIKTKHLQAEDLIIDEIKSREAVKGSNKQPIIKFTVPSVETNSLKDKYLRELTKEETEYIDAARKDLEISPNQAASYRFDSHESAGKDFYQKLEYKGNLIDTKDQNILDLVKSLNESENETTTGEKNTKSTSSVDTNAGADSYILDLIKRQLVVKFAKSVNIPDTTVDSAIDLNDQTYRNISAYVNHITPELVIAPDSPAFRTAGDKDNTKDGILSHLLKFSTKLGSDDDGISKAEINYIKLIPYIIKVLQMIDPKYFITESVLTIKSDQVPEIKADQINRVLLDSDGTIADSDNGNDVDDNLSRLSFNLTVQRGGLQIDCYEPIFPIPKGDTTNSDLDTLIKCIKARTTNDKIKKIPDGRTVFFSPSDANTYKDLYWEFLNLVYTCKKFIAAKTTNNGLPFFKFANIKGLDEKNDKDIIQAFDNLAIKLSSISWIWDFDDQNLHLLLSKDPDGSASSLSKDSISLIFTGESDPLFAGLDEKEKPIFANQVCLKRQIKLFKDTESDLVSSYSWRPYIETYRASYNKEKRYSFVIFKLTSKVSSDSGTNSAQVVESNKDIKFLIKQKPNIIADPNIPNSKSNSPTGVANRELMRYNKEGTKIKASLDENKTNMIDPELHIDASGIIRENINGTKKHVIHVSHSNVNSDGTSQEDVKFNVEFEPGKEVIVTGKDAKCKNGRNRDKNRLINSSQPKKPQESSSQD